MIIQCGGCGRMENTKHRGTPEQIEANIHMIIERGWRWSPSHNIYICPECSTYGIADKFYSYYAGHIRKANKIKSYSQLLTDVAEFMDELRR